VGAVTMSAKGGGSTCSSREGRRPSLFLGSDAARLSFAMACERTSAGVGGDVPLEDGLES
jgi:hypothetical protein